MPRSSKRRPLRDLIRHFPVSEERLEIINTLNKRDDHSAALVSGALMEGLLEKLLLKKFLSINSQLEARIFDQRGPLSDFDSKILIATAMGIIPEAAANLLSSIRQVRNVFGHSLANVSFENNDIKIEVERHILPFATRIIKMLNESDEQIDEKILASIKHLKKDSKNAFCVTIFFLALLMDIENPATDDLNAIFLQLASS